MRQFLVVNGFKAVKEYEKILRRERKEYKELYKGWGYMFKEVKPRGAKKAYSYWYKWEYDTVTKNNIWTYVGKTKPTDEIPDPPMSRMDDIEYNVVGDNIIIVESEFDKIEDIFNGYQKFEIQPA